MYGSVSCRLGRIVAILGVQEGFDYVLVATPTTDVVSDLVISPPKAMEFCSYSALGRHAKVHSGGPYATSKLSRPKKGHHSLAKLLERVGNCESARLGRRRSFTPPAPAYAA